MNWPYKNELGEKEIYKTDVLVVGGGIAGCMAAISAAKSGQKVMLIEKGATERSGAGGSGCDHWESAATNPGSKVKPEDLVKAMIDNEDGYNNGISHYIECREGYDTLLEIEKMGGKIRDNDDEFLGAKFRDEKTKLLYAYDYENKMTIRIWGTTFKPAMYNELKRLGVQVVDRVMVTSLLTLNGKQGDKIIGATGFNNRTGKFMVFEAKATIMCMSRPARVWLFSEAHPGLSEFRPLQCIGDGHAMGWRSGAEFNMMEKSVRAEFSAAGQSFPPYGAGNNHNTWYPATLIDSRGKEIPYLDRDGNELKDFYDRTVPAYDQPFFLKGGNIDEAKYAYDGPETVPFDTLIEMGYVPPFYADLTEMPDHERNVIWGMMVGEEGKTRVPILKNYTDRGFDPKEHVLQCYGAGWKSSNFSSNERQLFGLPGGFYNDWKLMSSQDGLFVAGDALFASNCYGHAASTGSYAGRHAAEYASTMVLESYKEDQVRTEEVRLFGFLEEKDAVLEWKEINASISKIMRNYCGDQKHGNILKQGLICLDELEEKAYKQGYARNPHELMRMHEVLNILTVSKLIIHACLERKSSSQKLDFNRIDYPEQEVEKAFILIKEANGFVESRNVPLDYYGDLKANYEKFNSDYLEGKNDI
ncbi:FAD-dependent oxidoreductase [Acidaminobacter sp. JC074]|uniref:FAD-dependent oxidoreductase n=1 Tax=Acidaminobacter sp. JC074 TaxID=2530199 RepID=UPI001F107660|nr:FAD-dependent oxidoreductase [Acidaminobacter sp. JC074]MCH4886314.1 FAD-dependent oxidoreductase [Acidaminobacter sp. JC074]